MAEYSADPTALGGPRLGLSDYVDILRRNLWFLVIPAAVVALIGISVVRSLPEIYTSTAKILIESQQIPQDLVRSTVTTFADERIEFVRQKVLTRANILAMVDQFGLYPGDGLSRTEKVRKFESDIRIDRQSANTGRSQTTIAFDLSFAHEDPRTAQRVASQLATLFLDENAATRTERATETTDFLRREAESIQQRIRDAETRISDFKQQNREQLPELFEVNMGKLERLEREYQQASMTLAGLERELRFLYAQAEGLAAPASSDPGDGRLSLGQLRSRLEQLLTTLTASHPDVRQLQRQIAELEAESSTADADAPGTGGAPGDPSYDADRPLPPSTSPTLLREVENVRERIQFLRSARTEMEAEIATLEARLNQAPAIEQEWLELQRGLSNLAAQYNELRSKELEAQMAQTLEEERKGERFVLLEPPVVPTEPSEPNLKKLYLLVLMVAGAAGGGLMILVELLQPGLRGDGVIAYHLGTMPMATIPYIVTPAESARRLRRTQLVLIGAGLLLLLAVALVHVLVTPLDMLYYQLLQKFGLD